MSPILRVEVRQSRFQHLAFIVERIVGWIRDFSVHIL